MHGRSHDYLRDIMAVIITHCPTKGLSITVDVEEMAGFSGVAVRGDDDNAV